MPGNGAYILRKGVLMEHKRVFVPRRIACPHCGTRFPKTSLRKHKPLCARAPSGEGR